MTRVFRSMYLRPGNLWKDFHLLRMKSSNVEGRKIDHFVDTAEMVRGVVAEASTDERERTKHLFLTDLEKSTLLCSADLTLPPFVGILFPQLFEQSLCSGIGFLFCR